MSTKKSPGTKRKSFEPEYRAVVGSAERLAAQLSAQVGMLLDRAGVALAFPIQHRVKEWSSIAEKFDRLGLRVKKITEIQDLVGLRIIILFRRDLARVAQCIRESLDVVRDYDTADRLKSDQFGYSSWHFVVRLPSEWLTVPSFAGLGELVAEIQLRTLAQHMWAEVSSVLQYKQAESVPSTIKRALFRGSAILETVDLEFDRILADRQEYRESLEDQTGDGRLDVDLLEKTLDRLLPSPNKSAEEDYADALEDLQHFGISTVHDLTQLINRHRAAVEKEEMKYVRESQLAVQEGRDPSGTSLERANQGVYFTHVGLVRTALGLEIGNDVLVEYWDKNRESG